MSVVVARVGPTHIEMASDSRITLDHYRDDFTRKIVLVRGALVGMVGTPLWVSFVEDYDDPLDTRADIQAFALAWLSWVQSTGGPALDSDGGPLGCMLVAPGTPGSMRVFQVCNDGSAFEAAGSIAIGSGGPFAMGALDVGVSAARSVEAAIHLDPSCGGRVRTWSRTLNGAWSFLGVSGE